MKIVHISTSDTGGAGVAALRQHLALLRHGIDSKFLCLHKSTSEQEVYQFTERVKQDIFRRLLQKIGILQTNQIKNRSRIRKSSGEFEIFTFPFSDFDVLNSSLVASADFINLHWVGDFLDYPSFFKNVNKPIVWTLHDKNPALGGFHLIIDKEKNPLLSELEADLLEAKIAFINQVSDLQIVTPSRFLLNYSQASKSLCRFDHHFIPNSIDLVVFKQYDPKFSRETFNLPPNKRIVLFLNTTSYHKGADVIVKCIENFEYKDVHFVGLGHGFTINSQNISYLNDIKDERLMAILYSAADLFLLPSREDNLPNMMLESLACGTPVIGFPTGGVIDFIQNGFNGLVTSDLSVSAMNKSIVDFFENRAQYQRSMIRDFAVLHFDMSVQAKRYLSLYRSILNQDKNCISAKAFDHHN